MFYRKVIVGMIAAPWVASPYTRHLSEPSACRDYPSNGSPWSLPSSDGESLDIDCGRYRVGAWLQESSAPVTFPRALGIVECADPIAKAPVPSDFSRSTQYQLQISREDRFLSSFTGLAQYAGRFASIAIIASLERATVSLPSVPGLPCVPPQKVTMQRSGSFGLVYYVSRSWHRVHFPRLKRANRSSDDPGNFNSQNTGSGETSPPASNSWQEVQAGEPSSRPTPLSVDDAEQENPHIVGPVNTSDSQVLADYLSVISNNNGGVRMVRPLPGSRSKPVLFSTVAKRPLGMDVSSNPSREKLQIIEKLLEPYLDQLIHLYFEKIDICFPLLDVQSFKQQYRSAKDKISPALLSCLLAHTLVHWSFDPFLYDQRRPDIRFIWNLATEALYSELHLSPGISTVVATILNIGGRPTTSLVGNGVQLGAAVSLAHSLGLNRNPLPWDIPDAEKVLRMKIWWSLLLHDKWSSLAYGTPSHIQRAQYDVPAPSVEYLQYQSVTQASIEAVPVFVALFGLTEVLDVYLQHLYHVVEAQGNYLGNLEYKLNHWIESLEPNVRRIVTRGTRLGSPGAANLRLSYLSAQLLLRRLELENDRDTEALDPDMLDNRYMQVRRTAEEIVLLVQELQVEQLGDFWLPVTAFVFPSTTTFLLRCALETENSQQGLANSSSLRLAWDLIVALRDHRDKSGWDLGDMCLSQHAEVVEKLMGYSHVVDGESSTPLPDFPQLTVPDASFIDQLFPSIWDTLRDT
ncbi:hypothetical protein SCAR479_00246 [Seiridium cardinale]|uniref:Xylanolytic transcriptional activator regulatory domain-containing protein n=1 Tax=Seiridium cardinale TaxID=138064 RepID=A0ABR2Y8Y8_9PEZI